ncbi:MAG: hypothetical protein LBU32_29720 [Clostridiales bacterium]|nr:hypothetical protein [Clostridiales bacterium]
MSDMPFHPSSAISFALGGREAGHVCGGAGIHPYGEFSLAEKASNWSFDLISRRPPSTSQQ